MEQVALQETQARRWFDLGLSSVSREPGPIRDELFSVERLEQFAETLAQTQPLLASSPHGRALLVRPGKTPACCAAITRPSPTPPPASAA